MKRNIIARAINKMKSIVLRIIPQNKDAATIRKKSARKLGRQLRLKKKKYIFSCDTLSPLFYLPLYRTDYIQQRILTEKRYYEQDNLDYVSKKSNDGIVAKQIKNGCILDIGTNIGNHTLYFFFECGIKKAFCFEPIDSTFEILKKNIEINNLKEKTVLNNVAVGAEGGLSTIAFYDEKNIGSTQIALEENGEIPVVSIDSMQINEPIKLIKVDVEGFEVNVLRGCIKTIGKYRPYILIEIQAENFETIQSLLSAYGYKYEKLNLVNYFFYV